MTILSEMRSFLDGHIEDARVNKQRNIDLICYYYGFGDSELPTQKEAAQRFLGSSDRERARQIIEDNFRNPFELDQIPSISRFQEVLDSQLCWASSTLEKAVVQAGLAGESFSLRGLVELLRDLGLLDPYRTYSPDMKEKKDPRMSRRKPEYILLQQDLEPQVSQLLRMAKTFPGRRGIARFEDLEATNEESAKYKDLLLEIVLNHPDVWMPPRDDGKWYLFENRDNSLINHARKALTFFDKCDLNKLPESIYKALDDDRKESRGQLGDYRLPSVDLIEHYLRTSRFFVARDSILYRSPSSFKPKKVGGTEKVLVEHMGGSQGTNREDATSFLSSQGHNRDTLGKTLDSSPLIFIDKTLGRGHHIYQTVEWVGTNPLGKPPTETWYSRLSKRLQEFDKTDIISEQQTRAEQDTLRDSFFAGEGAETCALCGREFSVKALVAAHKKRRADCNEGERRDPLHRYATLSVRMRLSVRRKARLCRQRYCRARCSIEA